MIIIGAGSAGLVSAYIGAAVKAKTALIEKHKMGGDCLNTGCIPNKALIRSAKILSYAARAKDFGFKKTNVEFDFADIMERVQNTIKKVAPHDSVERYSKLSVHCIEGEAKIVSPYEVQVNGETLTTKSIIIATGTRPFVPPIPGLDQLSYLTSDNVWELRTLPQRLVILGGGPIGCGLTQAFARFGTKVTQVEKFSRIMRGEDEEISQLIKSKFEKEGVDVLTEHRAIKIEAEGELKTLVCDNNGAEVRIPFDEILIAVGRVANIKGFGLEELGVAIFSRGAIETNFPNIYCAGDVAGPYQFTHTAAH